MIYSSNLQNNNSSEILEKLSKAKELIIFGTGNYGMLVLGALKKKNIKVDYFCDNNKSRWGKVYGGLKVISPEDLKKTNNETPILITSLNFPYIKRQLKDLGLSNYYDCDFLLSEINLDLKDCGVYWNERKAKEQLDLYLYSVRAQNEKKNFLKINTIDLVLTEKCSLKCKECSNLMQYYSKPVDEDFEQLTNSLDTFMRTVDHVSEVRLIGGEPMLYKKIDLIIKQILNYKNFDKINIYTNGTIVLKDEKMKVFQNKKIMFEISDYGAISRNVSKLENTLSRMGIPYITHRVSTWQDCAKMKSFERTESVNKSIFGNCCENQGLTMLHGKLYLCPFSAHATNLKGIPYAQRDIVNIENKNKEVLKNEISKLYFETEYLEACKSCNGRDHNVSKVEAAVQTKEPLKYEIVN